MGKGIGNALVRHVGPKRGFTQLSNAMIRDGSLSYKARGILAELLSYPEDWETSERSLAQRSQCEGRDAIRSGLRELEGRGYLHRERARADDGTLGPMVWHVTDDPAGAPWSDYPTVAEPTVADPTLADPTTTNTDLQNTDPQNTEHEGADRGERPETHPVEPSPAPAQPVLIDPGTDVEVSPRPRAPRPGQLDTTRFPKSIHAVPDGMRLTTAIREYALQSGQWTDHPETLHRLWQVVDLAIAHVGEGSHLYAPLIAQVVGEWIAHAADVELTGSAKGLLLRMVRSHDARPVIRAVYDSINAGAGLAEEYADDRALAIAKYANAMLRGERASGSVLHPAATTQARRD